MESVMITARSWDTNPAGMVGSPATRRSTISALSVPATLSNESLKMNDHRIETFGLREYFSVFMSSCYLGMKKPEEGIYRVAV